MALYRSHDLEKMVIHWKLIPHSKRPYWAVETLNWLQGLVMPELTRHHSSAELVAMMTEAREIAAEELGLPPWNQ